MSPTDTAAAVSEKEFEASLSLLRMMQRGGEAPTDTTQDEMKGHHANRKRKAQDRTDDVKKEDGDQLDASTLLQALHDSKGKMMDDDLDSHQDNENQPPTTWTNRGFLRRNAQLNSLSRELNLDELRAHFGKPIVEVAREFGICTTFLKKICRRCGIKRWPHRQIRSLSRTIQMLRQAEVNATSTQEKTKIANQIKQMEAKMQAVIEDPDANGKLERVKKSSIIKNGPSNPIKQEKAPVSIRVSTADEDHQTFASSHPVTPSNKIAFIDPIHVAIKAEGTDREATFDENDAPFSPIDANAMGLRISPSHRKLLAVIKSDAESRLRTSSIGSLQDEEADDRPPKPAPSSALT